VTNVGEWQDANSAELTRPDMQNDHRLKERQLLVPTIATSSIPPIATVVIATTIFVVDAIAPAQIADSALYIPVVLLATRFCRPQGVLFVA
jgi:hypothetical protein